MQTSLSVLGMGKRGAVAVADAVAFPGREREGARPQEF